MKMETQKNVEGEQLRFESMNEWMNQSINEGMNEWMDEWMNEWIAQSLEDKK